MGRVKEGERVCLLGRKKVGWEEFGFVVSEMGEKVVKKMKVE